MASPASIGGHPIHPMLIPFPLALWVFSFMLQVIVASAYQRTYIKMISGS
jgi:uncharacterized membrane protein